MKPDWDRMQDINDKWYHDMIDDEEMCIKEEEGDTMTYEDLRWNNEVLRRIK